MTALAFALVAVVSAVAAEYGVSEFIRWATRAHVMDIAGARSSHTQPTPRGGGVVMAALVLGGAAAFIAWTGPASGRGALIAFLLGGSTIAAVSWYDDLSSLPAWPRLAVHLLVAVFTVRSIGYWREIDVPIAGVWSLGRYGAVLTVCWIVGLINALNFMDGIDGIAGTQAVIAAAAWAGVAWWIGSVTGGLVSVLIAASAIGFLVHNWPPARVFMGDVGSAFLGYALASLPLLIAPGRRWAPVAGLLFVWPFVFDTAFTLIRRATRGENLLSAHRSHLYQRLVIAGRSARVVTPAYGAMALVGCGVALGWVAGIGVLGYAAAVTVPAMAAALWATVRRSERPVRAHLSHSWAK